MVPVCVAVRDFAIVIELKFSRDDDKNIVNIIVDGIEMNKIQAQLIKNLISSIKMSSKLF